MAKFNSVLCPGQPGATQVTINATTASAEQAIGGTSNLIAFVADQACTIMWGVSGSVTTPSAANAQYIPANALVTFDTSRQFNAFKIFNTSGSTTKAYWWYLSVV